MDDLTISRVGALAVPIPAECGKVLGMSTYGGRLYLNCEAGLYEYRKDSETLIKVCTVGHPAFSPLKAEKR